MQWYYAKENEQLGPVNETEFQRLIDTEEVLADTLVWNSTLENWVAAATIEGLFPEAIIPTIAVAEPYKQTTTDISKLTLNHDLIQRAKASLKGHWAAAAGIYLLYGLIIQATSYIPFVGSVAIFIIAGPFLLGLALFFLGLARRTDSKVKQLFDGFKTFEISMVTYLLTLIFTMLWTLLLIIPGIIAGLSYSMAYFIIIDNPNVSATDAITRSKELMMGNKMKYFCMQWRFTGWILLAIATVGIGFIWLYPYMMTANAEFYEDIRKAQKPV